MDQERADAYLAAMGAERPRVPDASALAELQLRHLLRVPFENLDIHLGQPIVLTEEALLEKIVDRGRGGFCYELNSAFGALLAALGFQVTLLSARVFGGGDSLGIPFDHLALRVDLDEPWLVDVGFGRFAHHPLRLLQRDEQQDPGGRFQLVERAFGDLDVLMDGKPQYRLESRPRTLDDFTAGCWYQQTSPDSHFTQAPVCSRLTTTGRVTLSDRTLIETSGSERREEELIGDSALLEAYRQHFGITLPSPPSRRPVGG
ncbi:N-hydroxyarylamine O-acetyltransferase [Streptacidiphilus sp. MAP12-16]|uniref:arylamine N-acetyltransferase family protein n=1 Tax=Streptacidiphilus sp. MAP12-16 TaxID=3156300 RepID=UPI003511C643